MDTSNEQEEVIKHATSDVSSQAGGKKKKSVVFSYMADYPWPFMVVLPIIFCFLCGFGWSIEDKIEDEVAKQWIAQDGAYARDQSYARSLDVDDLESSTFLAMAVSRDGKNILTSDRLEAVRQRMEDAESVTMEYNGKTYTWDDLCASNPSPYMFPCLRLSPLDLYLEARWSFNNLDRVAYYKSAVEGSLLDPRLPRFGVMQTDCLQPCGQLMAYRIGTNNPLGLFADVGNLEYNDPCRICIENNYTSTIERLYAGLQQGFGGLQQAVTLTQGFVEENSEAWVALDTIKTNLQTILESATKDDVVDFYKYYVARGMYSQLGVQNYLQSYALFQSSIETCQANGAALGLVCPLHPSEVDAATAAQHLLNQADNAFSSVTTAGAPFPFWSEPDGTGALFKPNDETGTLFPVSGSGVDMSADIQSLGVYLLALQAQPQPVNPESQEWIDQVEKNPLYAWFMAGVTPADEGAVCGNDVLTGTATGIPSVDDSSAALLAQSTPKWCTPFNVPNELIAGPGGYTKQYFARMWYDLLLDSFLQITRGEDDPYSWTTGAGCGYSLAGSRFSFDGQSTEDILSNSSRLIYNIDEGASNGAVDPSLLLGGVRPPIGEYSTENPLTEVTVLQSIYPALVAKDIVERVKNCNRPDGPLEISLGEAEEVLKRWKEAQEDAWNRGWDDDNDGEIQFVSFYDDGGGAVGSTGRMLREITLDNNTLTIISIFVIAFFSGAFLFSTDLVESRVLLSLIGVALVVLSYFAGVGFALLLNVKINVAIAWTLPFVIIGLGVDDVYIVLLAIKKQGSYTKAHFLKAMREVIVPVTMTSLTNAAMFAIMNVSDIPAVYITSQVAVYCIIGLYLTVVFCFPAYCYLDMKRQAEGRMDVLVCRKVASSTREGDAVDLRSQLLYDRFYKKLILNQDKSVRTMVHGVIFLISLALFVVGCYGITERDIGLGLEDLFAETNPGYRWATLRTEELGAWSVGMNWGALDYGNPDTQMKMLKQFEGAVSTEYITDVDTKQLWMANFLLWTSRHCDENFGRSSFDEGQCGHDQMFEEDGSTCAGTWAINEYGLRVKSIQNVTDETCAPNEGGICRPVSQMHPLDLEELGVTDTSGLEIYCPVVDDSWSDDKWKFCLRRWRTITGFSTRLKLEDERGTPTQCEGVYVNDEEVVWPIPYSDGPSMFAVNLASHQITLDMMEQTRAICDNDPETHCWMSGIPFDYWSQYDGIFEDLLSYSGYALATGFGIAALFLFAKLSFEKNHSTTHVLVGSVIGGLLIAVTMICTLVTVVGLSILVGVNLTGFSNMAFILSVSFSVEYSVHIVSRWIRADSSHTENLTRIDYTMSFLMLPTFMSFVSSTIGVSCLAFTEFAFSKVFFFRPLMIVMFVSYWFGVWFLPSLLYYIDTDSCKLGPKAKTRALVKDEQAEVALDTGAARNVNVQESDDELESVEA